MTDACENTTRLDDAALDAVCGGVDAPQPPRVLPAPGTRFGQGWMFGMYQGPDGSVTCGKFAPATS